MGFSRLRSWIPTIPDVLILGGFALVALGAALPWVAKQLPVKVYVLGMQSGLERIWVRRLLGVAGVGILVYVGRFRASNWQLGFNIVLIGIGGIMTTITVLKSPLTTLWTPGRGVYFTLVGSLFVVIGACITLLNEDSLTPWTIRD